MGELAELGSTTRGVWTRKQALAVTTRGRIDALVRRGEWQAPWSGVYADGGYALDLEQRGFAAVLASGGGQPHRDIHGKEVVAAVACGRLAARLHDLPLVDDRDPATGGREHLLDDVALRWGGSPLHSTTSDGQTRTLTRHRRRYTAEQVLQLPSGLHVTSYAQTLVDCALLLQSDSLVCLLDALLHRELLSTADLDVLVRQQRWQAGLTPLREAVRLADGRAESPHETLVRLVLKPHLPGLEPQQRLYDESGRILARFDLADRRLRLAVEADGKAGHAGTRMAARDQRRDRISDARGWRTERCVWFETRCRQKVLVARVLATARDQERRHTLS
ncbi:MAG: hypothetical protein WD794_04700 [Mycobacteriales bacterium]